MRYEQIEWPEDLGESEDLSESENQADIIERKDVAGTNNARFGGPGNALKAGKPGPVANKKKGKEPGKDMDGGSVAANDTKRSQYKSGKNKSGTKSTGPTTSAKKTGTIKKK